MQQITDAMHEKKIPKGCYVIREGMFLLTLIPTATYNFWITPVI